MKIVFHEKYKQTDYASDGASVPGRMESIMDVLVENDRYKVVSPQPALYRDILRAHSQSYVDDIRKDAELFEMARLSAGGAIAASDIAIKNEPVFACIRPPGHHASNSSSWGYCTFCNIKTVLPHARSAALSSTPALHTHRSFNRCRSICVCTDALRRNCVFCECGWVVPVEHATCGGVAARVWVFRMCIDISPKPAK